MYVEYRTMVQPQNLLPLKVCGYWFITSIPYLAAEKSDAYMVLILLFSNMFLALKIIKIRNFIICVAVPLVSSGKEI